MLLEIGCGSAIHLANLASTFSQLIGVDISPRMVDVAWRKGAHLAVSRSHRSPCRSGRRNFSTIDDTSVDVVLCVGALEHMLDRDQVIR